MTSRSPSPSASPGWWRCRAGCPSRLDRALPANEALRNFPTLVIHGTQDPMIPVSRAQESRQRPLARGLNVHYREYPMQHEINPDALREIVVWLEEKVFQPIRLA